MHFKCIFGKFIILNTSQTPLSSLCVYFSSSDLFSTPRRCLWPVPPGRLCEKQSKTSLKTVGNSRKTAGNSRKQSKTGEKQSKKLSNIAPSSRGGSNCGGTRLSFYIKIKILNTIMKILNTKMKIVYIKLKILD